MSLDQFRSMSDSDQLDESEEVNDDSTDHTWDCNWHLYPGGYWEEVDEKYYGDDSPNQPPLFNVPEKLAAEINVIDDEDIVSEVSEWWNPKRKDDFNEVIQIVFNDFSTWHMPVRPWDEDYSRTRVHIVERYLPDVVKWRAILRGDDPDEVLEQWTPPWEQQKPDWEDDIDNTGFSEDTRQWLNDYASWMPHIDKEVGSESKDVELDIDEDDDWTDDW